MGIQRPRDHARRERGEVLPQAPREREARQARSFPPRRRTLRRRNRDRQRASIQKATWHRPGATDRTTELVHEWQETLKVGRHLATIVASVALVTPRQSLWAGSSGMYAGRG